MFDDGCIVWGNGGKQNALRLCFQNQAMFTNQLKNYLFKQSELHIKQYLRNTTSLHLGELHYVFCNGSVFV